MWKSEKYPRQQFAADQPNSVNGAVEDHEAPGADAPEAESFARSNPGAKQMLEELRGQPGFGMVVSATDMQPASFSPSSIGQRLTSQLDLLNERERQVRDIKDLATSRVVDLTTEQLRRILEFMV